jgi:hypothetical protein
MLNVAGGIRTNQIHAYRLGSTTVSESKGEFPFWKLAHLGSSLKTMDPHSNSDDEKKGRRKIKIEYIEDKSRRHITFSKRKAGIMKKAYELSTLTGTQVLLLVASETGHVYTFATPKLQPIITKPEGKAMIQQCLANEEKSSQAIQPSQPAPYGYPLVRREQTENEDLNAYPIDYQYGSVDVNGYVSYPSYNVSSQEHPNRSQAILNTPNDSNPPPRE